MDDIDGDETSRREEDLEGREIILIVEAVKRVIRVITFDDLREREI